MKTYPDRKAQLLGLIKEHYASDHCFPSARWLAMKTGLTMGTIWNYLKEMKDAGVITKKAGLYAWEERK